MTILNLWGIPFHPVVLVGLGYNFLFKPILAHCEIILDRFKFLEEDIFKFLGPPRETSSLF